MASYLDPRSWSGSWSPLRGAGSWLDSWVATTSSWVDPVATLGAGTVTALLPDVLMSVLSEGISRQFTGREIDLSLHGQPIRAILNELRVRRRGAFFETEIFLTDVDWVGHPVHQLRIVAHGVRLVPGVPTRLETRQCDVIGTISMQSLVAWLNSQELDWRLSVTPSGHIHAEHRQRKLSAVVDASVVDDLVRIKVLSARWNGLPLPKALLPARAIPLGPLPYEARVVSARRHDHEVEFVLDLPSFSGSLDLGQIRNAIVAGTGLIVW
ncbi:hypothetical protein FOS14_13030 [Skermania sp. ID1734]|uniref:hypothetical protein n=1 Tax=Skermania sp. ID1734 TaxID=2597516 RepID=UPI00117D5133|nr:hypothetical protein [Skermania sp. ID1734]TSD99273.1 hypothetical protein FOS14_13030 [Skermania sp. ID1734]